MKQRFLPSSGVLAALLVAVLLGGISFSAPFARADIQYKSGTITTSTVWTSDHTYVINNSVIVGSGGTLTIASGTVVKFATSTSYLQVSASGTLQINGASGNPAYFTSANDDSIGSTTPSSTGNPAPGNWGPFYLLSGSSSTINGAVIRYGGGDQSLYYGAQIALTGGNLSINNSQVASGTKYGAYMLGGNLTITSSTFSNQSSTSGGYGVYENNASGNLTITSSSFVGNKSAAAYIGLGGGINFMPSGNVATGTDAGYLVVGTLATSTTWYKDGVPYIVSGGSQVYVASGTTLTVNHGSVVKFENQYAFLRVNTGGTLDVEGTSTDPVYFTSINDNSVGGVTSGIATSTPAPGDWQSICALSGSSSTINNAIIRYGGSNNTPAPYSQVYTSGKSFVINNSQVASGTEYGVRMVSTNGALAITSSSFSYQSSTNGGYGVYENSASGTITIASSSFVGNKTAAVHIDFSSGATFTPSGNTASGARAGFEVTGNIVTSTTWYKDNIPYIILGGMLINSSTALTVNPGVVAKLLDNTSYLKNFGTFNVNGTSTDPAYFTSYNDNSIDPGTNGTTTSTAAPGDWGYLATYATSTTNFTDAIIRYGGGYLSSNYNIFASGGDLNILDSQISSSNKYGIYNNGASTTVGSSEIFNNLYGIDVATGTVEVMSSSIHDNSSYGMYNGTNGTSSAYAINNYWGSPSGPYNAHTNPSGNGDHVSDYVDFNPWLLNSASAPKESEHFDGSSALGYSASEDEFAATDPFTLAFWYRTNTSSSVQTLVDARQSNGASYEGYLANWNWNSGIEFFMGCASGTIDFNAAASQANDIGTSYDSNGIWHQVAITKGTGTNSSTFSFYFDGAANTPSWSGGSQGPISGNCFVSTSTALVWFGESAVATSSQPNNLKGDMEEVRIWNTQRSSSDIASDWNAEATSVGGLHGLWQFNGTSTDLITGNAPTLIGSPIFSTSTPLGGHFIEDQSILPTSVKNDHLYWYPSSTSYESYVDSAANLWTGQAGEGITIASTTNVSSADMYVSDISSSSLWWIGEWNPYPTSSVATLWFNTYETQSSTQEMIANTAAHELGHALGLDHSYFGNIMYYIITGQTDLGTQDTIDYQYLRDSGLWGN